MWRGGRQAYGNVRYLSSFLRLHPRIENCRLAEQKHENESSTRHGQRNYHIVSQLVRRGKCMQQFINHDAPYGREAVGEGGQGTAAGTHHILHWPQRTKTEQATTERKLCKCKLDEHKNENENETKKCDAQVGKGARGAEGGAAAAAGKGGKK